MTTNKKVLENIHILDEMQHNSSNGLDLYKRLCFPNLLNLS